MTSDEELKLFCELHKHDWCAGRSVEECYKEVKKLADHIEPAIKGPSFDEPGFSP